MARSGFPSMTALLGILAVAGYQNRDKIAEMPRSQGIGAGQGGAGGTAHMGGATTSGMGRGVGGLRGRVADPAMGNGNPEPRKHPLGLVFVDVHRPALVSDEQGPSTLSEGG